MSADDLHARFDAAADGLVPPVDPVGLVRARVGQRRRRRTQARVAAVSTAAVAVLVTAVVVGPDGFAPDAVAPAGAPTGPSEGAGPLLSPDGLPGLRLGDPAPETDEYGARETGSGCEAVAGYTMRPQDLRSAGGQATDITAWTRDGEVVALWLTVSLDRVELPGDVPRTWLGPTLRDAVSDTLAIEGSRLVTEDPLGEAGPGVTSVVVPRDGGGDVVFADVPYGERPSGGRITFIGLRTEEGRDCRFVPGVDALAPGGLVPGQTEALELTGTGTADVVLGSSAGEGVAAGLLTPVPDAFGDPLGGSGCTVFRTADDLQVWAAGDRVVAVGSVAGGPSVVLSGDVEVRSGQPADEVRSLLGAQEAPAGAPGSGASVDLPVSAGTRARVTVLPEQVTLEATGVLFSAGEVVEGVVLYEGDEPADSLC